MLRSHCTHKFVDMRGIESSTLQEDMITETRLTEMKRHEVLASYRALMSGHREQTCPLRCA